jgi:shikimate dehydrogenase
VTLPGRLVLLGHPVAHSLSPLMQNAALRDQGIPMEYEAVDVSPDALEETLRILIAVRGAGNVTLPHKPAVFARCEVKTPVAERVGAVNTFWVEGGRMIGDNTDVGGFDAAIRRAFGAPHPQLAVAVLGAGGGAAAVLAAVERWPGARAVIASRDRTRADALAARFARTTSVEDSYERAAQQCGLVVNATPIGLRDDNVPIDPTLLAPGALVFDLVYRRGATPWVVRARARGLQAEDGLRMLVEQGALAFQRWFKVEPDRDAMWRALERA